MGEELQAVQVKTLTNLVTFLSAGLLSLVAFVFTTTNTKVNENHTATQSLKVSLAEEKQRTSSLEAQYKKLETENEKLQNQYDSLKDRVLTLEVSKRS
ncbi:hypothetical protein NB545_07180 [Vibrio campbellii]|uniref:hypothetical protein n=1 Tax=Vibrio campbellii TaxID=680 RepID=UPI00168D1898|nr:hypothetical protein [Vibrio campbellii]MCR9907250.1 hypothetical protein [Vibrio campbellii]